MIGIEIKPATDETDNLKGQLEAVKRAIEEERAACLQIVREIEEQSARLMDQVRNPDQKEYYRGRGLGAATIAERIKKRGNS